VGAVWRFGFNRLATVATFQKKIYHCELIANHEMASRVSTAGRQPDNIVLRTNRSGFMFWLQSDSSNFELQLSGKAKTTETQSIAHVRHSLSYGTLKPQ